MQDKFMETISVRRNVLLSDTHHVESIVRSTQFFREDEVQVAVELVEERLRKGSESGYEFIFAEIGGERSDTAVSVSSPVPCTALIFTGSPPTEIS